MCSVVEIYLRLPGWHSFSHCSCAQAMVSACANISQTHTLTHTRTNTLSFLQNLHEAYSRQIVGISRIELNSAFYIYFSYSQLFRCGFVVHYSLCFSALLLTLSLSLSLTIVPSYILSFALSFCFYVQVWFSLPISMPKVKCLYNMTIKIPCKESEYYVSPKLMCIHWISAVHTHTLAHSRRPTSPRSILIYALYLHREYIYTNVPYYEKRKKGTKWAACKCKLSVEKKIASRKNKYTFDSACKVYIYTHDDDDDDDDDCYCDYDEEIQCNKWEWASSNKNGCEGDCGGVGGRK